MGPPAVVLDGNVACPIRCVCVCVSVYTGASRCEFPNRTQKCFCCVGFCAPHTHTHTALIGFVFYIFFERARICVQRFLRGRWWVLEGEEGFRTMMMVLCVVYGGIDGASGSCNWLDSACAADSFHQSWRTRSTLNVNVRRGGARCDCSNRPPIMRALSAIVNRAAGTTPSGMGAVNGQR